MSVDFAALFSALTPLVGNAPGDDAAIGAGLHRLLGALVSFDHVVIFAYCGSETPIDIYSTFDADGKFLYVTLYQAGPYLLDPFYQTARSGRTGLFRMRELAPDRFFSSEYYRSYYMQTRLAEEVGFFIDVGEGVTIVLSLMRKEASGRFPPAKMALLKEAEPLVAALARRFWGALGERFRTGVPAAGAGAETTGPDRDSPPRPENVWRDLRLTERETAIIDLVLQGHSSEAIGLRLNISTGTVKVHRRNVYRKLGISSQTQLLSLYLKVLQ